MNFMMIVNVNDFKRKKPFNVLPEKQRDISLKSKRTLEIWNATYYSLIFNDRIQ